MRLLQPVEECRRRRKNGEVSAIGCPAECTAGAREWASYDSPDAILAIEEFSRNRAYAIQLFERNHVLMRRNLENRIGRSVHNRFPGAQVLLTQFLDDLRTGGGF